jgi:hypothetical protein
MKNEQRLAEELARIYESLPDIDAVLSDLPEGGAVFRRVPVSLPGIDALLFDPEE